MAAWLVVFQAPMPAKSHHNYHQPGFRTNEKLKLTDKFMAHTLNTVLFKYTVAHWLSCNS
jgi:hypothetical protein